VGIAVGLFAGTMPHLHPTIAMFGFYLGGMIVFVCLSIHRMNKVWKFKTTKPPAV
jgi:hypothetical protein